MVGIKCIFRNTLDDFSIIISNKAWLIAQGFEQIEGICFDVNFTLVARLKVIRMMMDITSYYNFILK